MLKAVKKVLSLHSPGLVNHLKLKTTAAIANPYMSMEIMKFKTSHKLLSFLINQSFTQYPRSISKTNCTTRNAVAPAASSHPYRKTDSEGMNSAMT